MKTKLIAVLLSLGLLVPSVSSADKYPLVQVNCLDNTLSFVAAITKLRGDGSFEAVDADGVRFLISKEYCMIHNLGISITTDK